MLTSALRTKKNKKLIPDQGSSISIIQKGRRHTYNANRSLPGIQALDAFQICARNVMLTFHPRHSARLAECRMPNTTILERSKCINLHSIKQDALQSYLCVLPGIINTPIKFWSSNLRRHLYIPGAEVYSEAVGVPPWEPSTAGSLGLENALRYVTAMANLWPWSALRFLTCVTVAGFYWI